MYHLVVYVESSGNLGTIASAVPVTVPASNSFYTVGAFKRSMRSSFLRPRWLRMPTPQASTSSSPHMRPAKHGVSWCRPERLLKALWLEAAVADAASVSSATIKAGTGAHGGVCKVADQVGRSLSKWKRYSVRPS